MLCVCWGGLTAAGSRGQSNDRTSDKLDQSQRGLEKIELMKQGIATGAAVQPGGAANFIPTPQQESEGATITAPTGHTLASPDGAARDEAWRKQNWLVSGMQALASAESGTELQPQTLRAPDERRAPEGTVETWLELTRENSVEMRDADRASFLPAEGDPKAATNPLAGFMADWLDVPAGGQSPIAALSTDDPFSALGDRADVTFDHRTTELSKTLLGGDPSGSRSNPISSRDSRENPFIQDARGATGTWFGLPDLTASTGRDREPTLLFDAAAPAAAEPKVAPAETVPELNRQPWKPPAVADEKYFPRLNRF